MKAPDPILRCPNCQHTGPASEFMPPRKTGSQLVELTGLVLAIALGAVAVWLLAGGRLP